MSKKGFSIYNPAGTKLDFALECLGRGWNVVPVCHDDKSPHNVDFGENVDSDGVVSKRKWGHYKETPLNEAEAEKHWGGSSTHGMALITGKVSGVMILDVDSQEAADYVKKHGLESAVATDTRSAKPLVGRIVESKKEHRPFARHHWFKYDPAVAKDIGKRCPGLDVLTDGHLAMMYPSPDYHFEVATGAGDLDDLPEFPGFPADEEENLGPNLEGIDLSRVDGANSEGGWESFKADIKKAKAASPTGKIQEGNRNHIIAEYVGHSLKRGYREAYLDQQVERFMESVFEKPLSPEETKRTIESITQRDARNHPDRARKAEMERLSQESESAKETAEMTDAQSRAKKAEANLAKFTSYRMDDIARMKAEAGEVKYFMEPWVREGGIVQVFGYAGHGKSLFVQHAMTAITAGADSFGPFKINHKAKVLYFDYENGKAMIAERLEEMGKLHGHTRDNLDVWTPDADTSFNLDLGEDLGMDTIRAILKARAPDIIVIDTIRSAFPGLEENDKKAWNRVNDLAVEQSKKGRTVIMLHHSNKPTESGLGRSAGSSHQSTHLTRHVGLTQVFKDKNEAKRMAGIHEQTAYGEDVSIVDQLDWRTPKTHSLRRVIEIVYHKARDISPADDNMQWIGLAEYMGEESDPENFGIIVSSLSRRQRAINMAMDGHDVKHIASRLDRKPNVIRGWLGLT